MQLSGRNGRNGLNGLNGYRLVLWVLVTLEVMAIALALLFAAGPILDYALREYKAYVSNPSEKTLEAFRKKQCEEVYVRAATTASFAAMAG